MEGPAILSPRGPLPRAVYWRRRLVLIGAVLLLLVVTYSCTRDGGGAKKTAATVTGTPTPTAAPKRTTPPPRATPTPKTTPTPTTSPTPKPSTPCADKELKVEASTSTIRYPKGVRPVLIMSVTNTGKFACTRDLGQRARELRLTSGNDRVWSSDDCSPGGAADPVVLKSGERRTFTVNWSRKRSRPGCPAGQPTAAPGTYRVFARLGRITSPGAAFLIS